MNSPADKSAPTTNADSPPVQSQEPTRARSSRSAMGIAFARALERERPPAERVVDDPFARHFVGEFPFRIFKFFYGLGIAERKGPGVLGYLVARERYIDDTVLRYLERGMDQLVILGAGYDARAYRFARRLKGVRVFEVDRPATQASKREKAEHFLDEIEVDVTWVPLDFETDSLEYALPRHGFDPAARTLYVWQGVVPYLDKAAVESTLRFVRAHSSPGSALVFDYVDRQRIEGENGRASTEIRNTNRYSRGRGEQVQFGLDGATAVTWLEQMGFENVTHVTSEQLRDLYFTGPREGRQVMPGYGILVAEVGGKSSSDE